MPTNGIMMAASVRVQKMTVTSAASGGRQTEESRESGFADMMMQSLGAMNLTINPQANVKMAKQTSYSKQEAGTANEKLHDEAFATDNVDTPVSVRTDKSDEAEEVKDAVEALETPETDDTVTTEVVSVVTTLIIRVTVVVSEQLGVSPEELGDYMNAHGFDLSGLLDGSTLKDTVLAFQNAVPEDMISNEELLSLVNNIESMVEDILAEFSKEYPELKNFSELLGTAEIKEALESKSTEPVANDAEVVSEATSFAQSESKEIVISKPEQKEDTEEAGNDEKLLAKSEGTKESDGSEKAGGNEKAVKASETESETRGGRDSKSSEDKNFDNLFTQFTDKLVAAAENSQEISGSFDGAYLMREIVNQLTEQIKITISPAHTSLDMTLNPENLGKIALNITSKDGVMTATIKAENQVTKEAIESQIQTLRETIENQGIKVEAIEVTVSNFAFSQSKDTESKGSEPEQSQKKNRIRAEGAKETADEDKEFSRMRHIDDENSTVNYVA